MKTAFLYPGQGSQIVGMGIGVADRFPEALAVFDCASAIAGYDMYKLCAEGPLEKLSRTRYTQPALFTVEAAITDVLISLGFNPSIAAGHSLGEFGAWYAAGVFSFEDGFRLVSERGRIMDCVDPDGIGSMCAIIGLSKVVVEDVCNNVEGTVVIANINSPLQIVISGGEKAVEKTGAFLKEKGAKRVIPLNVSGAFHSPLMEKARREFSEVVGDIAISDAGIPVYTNVSAAPATDTETIREAMVEQLTSPVRWVETIEKIVNKGVRKALEIGPGNVLAGLTKRIDDTLNVQSVSDSSKIMEVVHE